MQSPGDWLWTLSSTFHFDYSFWVAMYSHALFTLPSPDSPLLSVINPENASYGVVDCRYAAVQLAQTTTRSVIGTLDLDQTFEEREAISSRVVQVLGEVSDAWGILVHRYELKNIVPPITVRDAMERFVPK